MRLILLAAALLAIGAPLAFSTVPPAVAQGCSGPDCARPGGPSGGHDCERERKDQVTS